ncbi:hypothetical protein AQI88_36365 [Streptomyces cellostaticus]|uniref:Peptidoglycan binding-like domain-containing protein n=1 Tax=Streptomyces cellostaticus TaxID=67285 RepID=A0A101NEA7_9ACTN|nr:peptidoglycan-binding protein [Streptomyces cellostaticus]KUM91570.1 hypothetical protein AQI88_36365 [Streptomyces cellostaticus]GHI06274.1 hypothetical protein Scel_45950 [Streptomyces cellostaticus]
MSLKSKLAQGAIALAVTGTALLGTSTAAEAKPGASYIGYNHVTSGTPVWCVQRSLNYIIDGHNWPSMYGNPPYGKLDEDGAWGTKTYQTVKWFQAWAVGGTPDGVVGPQTGQQILDRGDPYYNGSSWNGWGYCYDYVPSVV